MKTENISLELVSPYLVRGADNSVTSKPELRAPAFRGVLRYWFRAVAGGIIGDSNLDGLHQIEEAVFGSTERGSPIRLIVDQSGPQRTTPKVPLLPGDNRTERYSFQQGQRINLRALYEANAPQSVIDVFLAIFKIMVLFGGVGVRARRGYGSLCFIGQNMRSDEEWSELVTRSATDAICKITNLTRQLGLTPRVLAPGPSAFPCINELARISLGIPAYTSAQAAIDNFMMGHHEYTWLGSARGQRQSSPLWVKPVKIGDQFRLQFIVLASDFQGKNYVELNKFIAAKNVTDLRITGWNA